MIRRAFELFAGSCVVYLAVVACGSSSGGGKPIAETGGSASATGGSSQGGAPATGGSDAAGFGFGGIPDPTPDAGAAEAGDGPGPTTCDCPKPPDPYVPPEPLVVEAECDVVVEVNANLDYVYARIARPRGFTDAQLFAGSAMLTLPSVGLYLPPGEFTRVSSGLAVSDDEIVVNCGAIGTGIIQAPATKATFIFPR